VTRRLALVPHVLAPHLAFYFVIHNNKNEEEHQTKASSNTFKQRSKRLS
jgi:hypothetical protein